MAITSAKVHRPPPPQTRIARLDESHAQEPIRCTSSLPDFRRCATHQSEIGARFRTISSLGEELPRLIPKGAPSSDLLYKN